MTRYDNDYPAVPGVSRAVSSDEAGEPLRPSQGFKHDMIYRDMPFFEGRDIVAGLLGATMMLGPLLAYAVGLGPS
jgi:hypothetical protein